MIMVGLVVFFNLSQTRAAINKQINYQGKLTDTSNQAVEDGDYNMTFRLYTTPTGATSSNIWEEISTSTNAITVTSGLFSVLLGSTTPLTSVDFNQTLYLGVEIGATGTPVWDGEMTPRKKIGAVPAAFEADQLDGIDSTSFLRSDTSDTMASTSASTLLTVQQDGDGNIVDFKDGSDIVMTILNGGNVGIGTSTPYSLLTLKGTGSLLELTDTSSTTIFKVTDTGSTTIGSTIISPNASSWGNVLVSDGSDAYWQATSTLGLQIAGDYLEDSDFISNGVMIRTGAGTYISSTTLSDSYVDDNITASNYLLLSASTSIEKLSNLATVGTITAGTWQGTAIDDAYLNMGSLGALADVSTSSISTNDVLYYTGTGWDTTATSSWASQAGTVSSGTQGQVPYYASSGTTLTATSALFIDTTGNIGIGTTELGDSLFKVGASSDSSAFVSDTFTDTTKIATSTSLDIDTSAGQIKLASTTAGWTCGDTIDYGGDTYNTVELGDGQCWMKENLKVTDGNEDQDCTFTRYCYGDTAGNCDTYGGLYTWDGIMCGEASSNTEPSGVQGICPNSWHIPSDAEWHTLEDYYDSGTCSGTRTDWGCDPAGAYLAGNASLWNNGSLDSHANFGDSGMDILPAGYRDTGGSYYPLSFYAYLWSSTEHVSNAWVRLLNYFHTDVYRYNSGKDLGFSVRCVRD